MLVNYFIENWIFVIDTALISLLKLPIKAFTKIVSKISLFFGGRLDKLFILNPSQGLYFSWKIAEGLIDPDTKDKIKFLKPEKYPELQ